MKGETRVTEMGEDATVLALKMEAGDRRTGMQVALRS